MRQILRGKQDEEVFENDFFNASFYVIGRCASRV
jgi:hypothetical protein